MRLIRTNDSIKADIEESIGSLELIKYGDVSFLDLRGQFALLKQLPIGILGRENRNKLKEIDKRLTLIKRNAYSNLTSAQTVYLTRHTKKPKALDYMSNAFEAFLKMGIENDSPIIGGTAKLDDISVVVLGIQKHYQRNNGSPKARDYRQAINFMDMAQKLGLPLITLIDTPGAFPDEENVQGKIIAESIYKMLNLKVPTISLIIGEGGSGGALAMGAADKILMLDNSYFSSISPEGALSIFGFGAKNDENILRTADALHLTAKDNLERRVIDEIVKEPEFGAHTNPNKTYKNVNRALSRNLKKLIEDFDKDSYLESRLQKFRDAAKYERSKDSRKFISVLTENPGLFKPSKKDLVVCTNPRKGVSNKACKTIKYDKLFGKKSGVCPSCNYHFRIPGRDSLFFYLNLIVDKKKRSILFKEFNEDITSIDLSGDSTLSKKIERYRDSSKTNSSLITGYATIGGYDTILALSNFAYAGGTLGGAEGEKFILAVKEAIEKRSPFISLSQSGGVRIQEGTTGLMQMASTLGAVSLLNQNKIPYISIMANPTTGGVIASYAFMGDVNITEPDAQLSFAGKNVIQATTGVQVEQTFLDSNSVFSRYNPVRGDGVYSPLIITNRKNLKFQIISHLDKLS